jgi:hypothetical protein
MAKSQPTRRYVDQLAATQREQFRERVEDAFRGSLDAKAKLQEIPASRRAIVLGEHMNILRKELRASLRESCDVYSAIAVGCSDEIGNNLLAWVEERIMGDFALASDEQRIYRWVIAACESDNPKHVNAETWVGPAWLGFASPGLTHALTENELNGKLDEPGTKTALKAIHLRLFGPLHQTVYRALFHASQRIEFERKLRPKHIPEERVRTGRDSPRRAAWVAKAFGRAEYISRRNANTGGLRRL